MRGGALRYYKPENGQGGRGLGGLLKTKAANLADKYVTQPAKRMLKRKANQLIKSQVASLLGQSGGALRRRGRKRRRRIRRGDIFVY